MAEKNKGKYHPFFTGGKNFPEVIAHRGGAGEFPGETIYAFEQAIKLGADVLEMDIRFTSDGKPILMHNSNVWETTGVDERVKKFTLAEITSLSAAYRWEKAGAVFPPGTVNVPSLAAVFEKFRGQRMNIEIKPLLVPLRLIKKFGDMIRHYDMSEKVLVASGCHRNLRLFRREFREIATSASLRELATFRALKSIEYKRKYSALQLSSKWGRLHFITQKYVEKARNRDLKVHGWTVNEPDEMARLISLGVDGIITDYPSVLLELLGRIKRT